MFTEILIAFLRTMSDIITAGVAITGFSLLIYAFTFNMRMRVTWTLALILFCLVFSYSAEAFASISTLRTNIEFWMWIQWVGIVLLPPSIFHFSDAILELTGKPSRGKRSKAVIAGYLVSLVFLGLLFTGRLLGPVMVDPPISYVQPITMTYLFEGFFLLVMAASWYNLARAVARATTVTSRRRLGYVLLGSMAPILGTFPFLPLSPNLPTTHPLIFWSLAFYSNFIVIVLIVLMAYSVAFFGAVLPDRYIRSRLVRWLLRGPVTASVTLGVVILLNRATKGWGWDGEILIPVAMAGTILLLEHLITLLTPLGERWITRRQEQSEISAISHLESRLFTRSDLVQFLEVVLSGMSDLLQGSGGYVVGILGTQSELVVDAGSNRFRERSKEPEPEGHISLVREAAMGKKEAFAWEGDLVFPLMNEVAEDSSQEGEKDEKGLPLVGIMGISAAKHDTLDASQLEHLDLLVHRAENALRDWQMQNRVLTALEALSPGMEEMQRLRAEAVFNRDRILEPTESEPQPENLLLWVRDALNHFWGGPKLTDSPLADLRVVKEMAEQQNGNMANAVRALLRKAIDQIRPAGERRFTGEWILYNILEMKFVEGKKVREVAMRLAMSEADLYRKQRVAIESVARAISEMEINTQRESPHDEHDSPDNLSVTGV